MVVILATETRKYSNKNLLWQQENGHQNLHPEYKEETSY